MRLSPLAVRRAETFPYNLSANDKMGNTPLEVGKKEKIG
ncbi:hypothetical protein LEP1GSC185_3722 [Leptospira licerasiae serovar Varillal str. VAR 010]|uniref:Uncharacterized protein n=1 Tax=Leptospira licerasiae str. MMD4847 TaxID=1049971 RepID=A0ABP2RL28_9LEPT|nr:hypothetical protein LEP1GSC185_3722 [Leptospira licerasiae serovar Varillal str. VAR 010]EJZ43979.1 hypothetical protein LEP1GSC178_2171 [Leptospira licerasiae str. MMD4847]